MEVRRPRTFISPTDFNCMGCAIPAAIGEKLANPETPLGSIVGDGAFLMTLGDVRRSGIATAVGARHIAINENSELGVIGVAAARHAPVIIDIRIDYAKRTRFARPTLVKCPKAGENARSVSVRPNVSPTKDKRTCLGENVQQPEYSSVRRLVPASAAQ